MKIKFIFIVLIILLSGSCIPTKNISFESLQPAGFSFPHTGDSILILNNSYYPRVDTSSVNKLSGLDSIQSFMVDTLIVKSIFDGLFSVLDHSKNYDLHKTIYHELRTYSVDNYQQPLDLESIDLLCENFKTNMIISLEYYGFNYKHKFFNDGFVSTPVVEVNRALLWRIYMKEMGMLLEYPDREILYWDLYIGKEFHMPDTMNSNQEIVLKECFWLGGQKFGNYISPGWQKIDRTYFPFLYKGKEIALEADELLRFISVSGSKKKKYKAWYNLAVLYEQKGEPENALKAINSALFLFPKSPNASEYKKELSRGIETKKYFDLMFD